MEKSITINSHDIDVSGFYAETLFVGKNKQVGITVEGLPFKHADATYGQHTEIKELPKLPKVPRFSSRAKKAVLIDRTILVIHALQNIWGYETLNNKILESRTRLINNQAVLLQKILSNKTLLKNTYIAHAETFRINLNQFIESNYSLDKQRTYQPYFKVANKELDRLHKALIR